MANPSEEGMLERQMDHMRHQYEDEHFGGEPERDWYEELLEIVNMLVTIELAARDGNGGLSDDDLETIVTNCYRHVNAVYVPMMIALRKEVKK